MYGEIKCACGRLHKNCDFFSPSFLVLKIFCLQPCWLQDISRKRVATTTTCNTSPVLSDYSAFCMVKHLSAQTSRHVHAEHNEFYHWVICSETYSRDRLIFYPRNRKPGASSSLCSWLISSATLKLVQVVCSATLTVSTASFYFWGKSVALREVRSERRREICCMRELGSWS